MSFATNAKKVWTGKTIPGQTNWQKYTGSMAGVYVDVDTAEAGFTSIPIYLTSLGGDACHWETTGATSVYQSTTTGFRVYVKFSSGAALTPAKANENKWHINWIGIEL